MANNPITVVYEFSLIPQSANDFLHSLEGTVTHLCLTRASLAPRLRWKFRLAQNRNLICLYANSDLIVEFGYMELAENTLTEIESRLERAFLHYQPNQHSSP